MQKFKQIREAAKYNPYAIGMAAAKKKAGYGAGPAEDLPKAVIRKGHEIAKKIKANEEFEADLEALEEELEFIDIVEQATEEELIEFLESAEFDQLDELSKKTLASYISKAADDARDRGINSMHDQDKRQGVKDFVKSAKRVTNIGKAANKLAGAK